MNLILLGLPAAGKGTQAKLISQEYNLTHISTGDTLRKAVRENHELGQKIKKYLDAGQLVPDEMAIRIVEEKLQQESLSQGFVFDGFPRTKKQAEALTKILAEMNEKLDLAIYIEVAEEEAVKRIAGRRVCTNCGASYHLEINPPKVEGICDRCGGQLIQRSDDKEDTVRQRIRLHSKLLEELITYYKGQDNLAVVVSKGSIQEVFSKIKETIKEHLL